MGHLTQIRELLRIEKLGDPSNPRYPYCGGSGRCSICGKTCSEAGGLIEEGLCANCASNNTESRSLSLLGAEPLKRTTGGDPLHPSPSCEDDRGVNVQPETNLSRHACARR